MKDINKLITDKIDVWTGALHKKSSTGRGSSKKVYLIGIKKLRQLILELAVCGKLTQQKTSDTPVSILLRQLEETKDKLVKAKKIKKPKKFSKIATEEAPHLIPNSWKWIRFGDCVSLKSGTSFPKDKELSEGEIPYCKVGDMNLVENLVELKTSSRFINPSEKEVSHLIPEGSIAFPKRGGAIATNKKRFIYKPIFVDLNIMAATPFEPISLDYIMTWLDSIDLAKLNTGTSVPQINNKDIEPLMIPCPPLEEQSRIVSKVEELMVLCDQLEQQTEASIDAHHLLVEELLSTLTNSKNAQEFEQNWTRIAEHFDLLFTTEHSFEQLKQTILQLAVMGKLVPQDPTDEPASKLIERIAQEKEQLIKDKKIKKPKELISFEGLDNLKKPIPSSWEWIKLEKVADLVRGGSPRPAGDPRFYDGDIPFLKVADVTRKSGKLVEGFNATIKEAGLQKTRLIETRTVLLSNSGATLGVPAICDFSATFNDGIAAFVEKSDCVTDEYLYLYLSTLTKWFLDVASRGQGQPNLNTDIIKTTWLSLPPLNEQKRIVTKVDDLTELCNKLIQGIKSAESTKVNLAEAIVEQALGRSLTIKLKVKEDNKTMTISTELSLGSVAYDKTAILAPLIGIDGSDAKVVWKKSGLELPKFYKQLKSEISSGYIAKPAKAEFEG